MNDVPMWQYLIWAMEGRGAMRTQDIYRAVKAWCKEMNRPLPPNWESVVRQTLQAHCKSRPQFKGRADIFVYHRRGHWSCNATSPSIYELLAKL